MHSVVVYWVIWAGEVGDEERVLGQYFAESTRMVCFEGLSIALVVVHRFHSATFCIGVTVKNPPIHGCVV